MKSEKMLFYLIIAIIIGLFLYVTYNLIITTCGCLKEGFFNNETIGDTQCTNSIYMKLKKKSQIGELCKVNDDCGFLNLRNFSGGNFYEYKRNGTTCSEKEYFAELSHDGEDKCERFPIPSTGNFDDNLFNNQDEFVELDKANSSFPTEFTRLGENNSYVNFIKNIFKKVLSVVSLQNLKFGNSDLSANYIDLKLKLKKKLKFQKNGGGDIFENISPSDIITSIGNKKIIDIFYKKNVVPDMSYNDIFKMEEIEVLEGDTIVKKYSTIEALKGEYKLVQGNLWKRNSDNINKFHIKYIDNKFYLCYDKEGKMIHLCVIDSRDIEGKVKSLDDVLYNLDSDKIYQGQLDASYNMTYQTQNDKVQFDSNIWNDISFCKDNYILDENNFKNFTEELFKDANWGNTRKDQCNEACFIDPQHVYYFDNVSKFTIGSSKKVFMSKDAWKNRTLIDGDVAANITWKCNKHCPDGLFEWSDISKAAGNGRTPDMNSSVLNDVNKYWFANQFGCPYENYNSVEEDKRDKVPKSLISAYVALTGNSDSFPKGNPPIDLITGKFENKDSCRTGADIYSKTITSGDSNSTNLIVEYYLRREAQDANIKEENLYIGSCDPTECVKDVNVMSGGILYKIKRSETCEDSDSSAQCNPLLTQYILPSDADIGTAMGNQDKISKITEYKCGNCRPQRVEGYLSFLTSMGDEESSSYSSSTKNDVNETLENPQQQCNENGDWLQRLKDMAKTEYYLDDSEKIREIGQTYLTQLCSCMDYKSTCAVSLLEAETIGKYFVQFAKGDKSMAELSEITSGIIKSNKFDLFSDMFGQGEVKSYDAIWDLDITSK